MGNVRHSAIVVTATYACDEADAERLGQPHVAGAHWAEVAREAARDIFRETGVDVTPTTPSTMNDTRSFLVAPDGSKEGWEDSDQGNEARAKFREWLRRASYGAGEGSPLSWVEIEWADDYWKTPHIRADDRDPLIAVWAGENGGGPYRCPACGSVGTGLRMPEHIYERHYNPSHG